MRAILVESNLVGTVDWLRANDPEFKAMDGEAAKADLISKIQRKLLPISVEKVASSNVGFNEIIWRGVVAFVDPTMGIITDAAGSRNIGDDERVVTLYVSPDAPTGNRHIHLG